MAPVEESGAVGSALAGLRPARESWGETFKGIAFVGGFLTVICTIVVLVISVTKGGVSVVTAEVLLISLVMAWGVALFIGIATRYEERTQRGTLAKIRKRQERRRDQPRDLVALATASASARRRWYVVARKRARLASLPRLALAVPIVLFFVSRGVSSIYKLYHPLGWGLAVIGTLGGVALILWSVRKQWGDPLLFVGQVEGVQHGIWKEGAVNWMVYGRTRTVDLVPRAICRLDKDGALRSHPADSGKQTLGVRRAVARKLIQGEHCALVCSGAGDVVAQCGALACEDRNAPHIAGVGPMP